MKMNLEEFKSKSQQLTSSERQQHSIETLKKILESIYAILDNELFQNDLNDYLFFSLEDKQFLNSLFFNLIDVILDHDDLGLCGLKIIKILSTLNIGIVMLIGSSLLKRFLILIEKKLDTNQIEITLEIILNLSEKKMFNRSAEIIDKSHFENLENLTKDKPIMDKIVSNFEKKTIHSCLSSFEVLLVTDQLFENTLFKQNLNYISKILNGNQSKSFDWEIFGQFDSFRFFSRLFEFLFDRFDKMLYNQDENLEEFIDLLKDIVEIIFRLVRRPLKYERNFIKYGMFQIILKIFENILLVKFIYELNLSILYKTVCIFIDISKFIYYESIREGKRFEYFDTESNSFLILNQAKDVLYDLHNQTDPSTDEQKPFYRVFLKALAYLQNTFGHSTSLLNYDDYLYITTTGSFPNYFKKFSNDFQSDLVNKEFINELNQVEVERVTRIKFRTNCVYFRNNYGYTFADILNQLNVIFSTNEAKLLAYETYKILFRVILFYGVDVEKILCLFCLKRF